MNERIKLRSQLTSIYWLGSFGQKKIIFNHMWTIQPFSNQRVKKEKNLSLYLLPLHSKEGLLMFSWGPPPPQSTPLAHSLTCACTHTHSPHFIDSGKILRSPSICTYTKSFTRRALDSNRVFRRGFKSQSHFCRFAAKKKKKVNKRYLSFFLWKNSHKKEFYVISLRYSSLKANKQ